MRALKIMIVIVALGFVLSAGPGWAQTAPPAKPPATPPAAQTPAEPAQKPKPPVPFPEGAKIAYIDYQYVAATANEGKAATAKIEAFQKKKRDELMEKNKALQAQQTKLQSGGNVLSDQARAQIEREIEKMQRELQFAQQDAQEEVTELQQQLQTEFGQKIAPLVEAIANEKGLHMVFAAPAGLAWAHPGLDISEEVVKRLDSPTPAKK